MMAILDEALSLLVTGLASELAVAGLTRTRGGVARGIAWAECSGRKEDGSWAELRFHHRASEATIQAGMIVYQPLSRGGRTVPIGELSLTYRERPYEVAPKILAAVRKWLAA